MAETTATNEDRGLRDGELPVRQRKHLMLLRCLGEVASKVTVDVDVVDQAVRVRAQWLAVGYRLSAAYATSTGLRLELVPDAPPEKAC